MQNLRFGIHSGQQYTSFDDLLALFRQAEDLGLDWASVFDHFLPIQCDPTGPCFDGLTTLAALAAGTRHIRCGMLVTGVTYRHPAMLAKIAVTIDHISRGRFELGMGAAWYEAEHVGYGIPFPPIGRRMDMLEEAVHAVKSLWTQTETTVHGTHYHLESARAEPKPLQKPSIPLWIGGVGEKRTLRIVARHADGWNSIILPVEDYRHKLAVLERHCQEVGRDASSIRRSIVFQAVLDTDRARAVERMRERTERLGNRMAPMGAEAVIGTPQDLVDRLAPFVQLGVSDFLLLSRMPADDVTLKLYAEVVAPALRA